MFPTIKYSMGVFNNTSCSYNTLYHIKYIRSIFIKIITYRFMHTFEGHGYSVKVCGIDNNWKVKIKPSPSPSFPFLSLLVSLLFLATVWFSLAECKIQNAKSGVSQHPLHSPPPFGVFMF